MRILVWGSRPPAAWLAARLHQKGHGVIWLNDYAEHIEALGGLEIRTPSGVEQVDDLPMVAQLDQALTPPPDWIIMAMPNWALDRAVIGLSWQVPPAQCPPILAMLTGIGGLEKITGFYAEADVVAGVDTRQFAWPILADGQIAYETVVNGGAGGIALSKHYRTSEIARTLEAAGLGPIQVHEQESLRWSDVLWQIQGNALPTLLNIPPGSVYTDERLFAIEYAQLREAVRVIDRLNVPLVKLPGIDVPRLAWQIRLVPRRLLGRILKANQKPPSLRDDLTLGARRSDAAYLNGVVARQAHELKIGAPVNHVLALNVTDMAERPDQQQQFTVDYLETLVRVASRHAY